MGGVSLQCRSAPGYYPIMDCYKMDQRQVNRENYNPNLLRAFKSSTFLVNTYFRKGLFISSILMVVGWSLVFLSSWLELIMIVFPGLFMVGLSVGVSSPLASIYITELSQHHNKGVLSSMFNFNLTFGILLTSVIGSLTK